MVANKGRQALPVIIERLNAKYPDARYELNFDNPLQLLVATILAAQCTDERVNAVTPGLFRKYPDAQAFANADRTGLEEDLKPTGFYRNKAKAVQGACSELVERYRGEVPPRMEDLITLPGVARKTANVVLNNAFRIPSGIIVDTHVARVSRRLGLTSQTRPEKIEQDLMRAVPEKEWIQFGPAMVLLGRYTCTFHSPQCSTCVMEDLCPKVGVGADEPAEADTGSDSEDLEAVPPVPETQPVSTARKKMPAKKPEPARKASTPPKEEATPSLAAQLPADWAKVLAAETTKPYFKQLEKFVAGERKDHTVFPPEGDVFNALKFTPYADVRVVLLGQDPYHDDGQAHGLCFSVQPGVKPPPSLVNIFKELQADVGCKPVTHGHLTAWARRGVLLLNTVLTVRAHEAASHKDKGWETFTDAIIKALNARPDPVVFLLWGGFAQKKTELIDVKKHRVLLAAHPSPLSAKKYFGSKPFSGANAALKELGKPSIDWQLPADPKDPDPSAKAASAAPAPVASPVAAPAPAPVAKVEPVKAPVALVPTPTPKPLTPVQPSVKHSTVVLPVAKAAAPPAPTPAPKWVGELPVSWLTALADEFRKPYFEQLEKFIEAERKAARVVPAAEDVFAALRLTPLDKVKAVIVEEGGPPATDKEADGLALSVRDGVRPTQALKHIFRELREDLGMYPPTSGSLAPWARQGVLLLNSMLTTRAGKLDSHANKGWETFLEAVLKAVNARPMPVAFVLWGEAQKRRKSIDEKRHVVVTGPHPEEDAFLDSKPFSQVNSALELRGQSAVYWQLFAL
jgi:uracil-DNA glycosylase